MFSFEENPNVLIEQKKVLEAALSTNPKTVKVLRKLIENVIADARKEVVQKSSNALKDDPRHAVASIRRIVYKKMLGANLNILNNGKAGGLVDYKIPRKLQPKQRGGNRVPRSERTNRLQSYRPIDRGFILRFVNSGTVTRVAGSRGGRLGGNRGQIAARDFFKGAAESTLLQSAFKLSAMIEYEMAKLLESKQ